MNQARNLKTWALALSVALVAMTAGCGLFSRNTSYNNGGAGTQVGGDWVAKSIPPRPATQPKIALGIVTAVKKSDVELYPQLNQNNIGLGLQTIVAEKLLESDWFELAPVDPQMLGQLMKLQEFYYHGDLPEGKAAEGKAPEYFVTVNITRIVEYSKETGGVSNTRKSGSVEVKVSYEVWPLLSNGATNMTGLSSGVGTVTFNKVNSLFEAEAFRNSAFGMAVDRAVHNATPGLIKTVNK